MPPERASISPQEYRNVPRQADHFKQSVWPMLQVAFLLLNVAQRGWWSGINIGVTHAALFRSR